MKRRGFIITGSILGGGLLVGIGGLAHVNRKIAQYSGYGMGEGTSLNAFIRISPDNTVTLAISKTEMGQGVYTALPQLIAEELEIEMDQIRVVHPQAEGPYANLFMAGETPRDPYGDLTMMQKVFAYVPNIVTGGSSSVRDDYEHLRVVGAMAREMLKSAAAKNGTSNSDKCQAEKGKITNSDTGAQLTYGDLAQEAAKQEAPETPKLKKPSEFKLVGKSVPRLDIPDKVTGKAVFGLDVRPENMKYAVIRHPSQVAGKIVSIKNQEEVEKMPGVIGVTQIEEGAVVVAETTWHARNGADTLQLEEEIPIHQEAISLLKASLENEPAKVWEDHGDIEMVLTESHQVIESTFEVPYLAHACMEPLNCTVLVENDRAEAWTGNQSSSFHLKWCSEGAECQKITSFPILHTLEADSADGEKQILYWKPQKLPNIFQEYLFS